MPFLFEEKLDSIYLASISEIKASKNSFFSPYSGIKQFIEEEKRVIFSACALAFSLDKLLLLVGLVGAACYAAKGVYDTKESVNASFKYSGEILKTSVSLFVLLYVDVLNLMTRILATLLGNNDDTKAQDMDTSPATVNAPSSAQL